VKPRDDAQLILVPPAVTRKEAQLIAVPLDKKRKDAQLFVVEKLLAQSV
jgi:hypothetical protein